MTTPRRPRVLVIFGTRPEAIKLFPLVQVLQARGDLEVRCCVTAQHRGMLDQVLAISGIVPDLDLDVMQPGQTLDALTARLLTGLGEVMDREMPGRVIVQGDTATAMAGAMAAYYRQIPVSHVEAGLRSYDIYHPWPEEVNRKIVGAIADQHFAPTDTAANALRIEHVPAERIHVTGNTVIDALHATEARIAADPTLASGIDPIAERFAGKRIIASPRIPAWRWCFRCIRIPMCASRCARCSANATMSRSSIRSITRISCACCRSAISC
jgi:UDP-N-acetylglucosamine 2-epimerase (non-hydrolysing)